MWNYSCVCYRPCSIEWSHKPHSAPIPYPTMYHFLTEMCTPAHISFAKGCTVGYLTIALWDLWGGSIRKYYSFLRQWFPYDWFLLLLLATSQRLYIVMYVKSQLLLFQFYVYAFFKKNVLMIVCSIKINNFTCLENVNKEHSLLTYHIHIHAYTYRAYLNYNLILSTTIIHLLKAILFWVSKLLPALQK